MQPFRYHVLACDQRKPDGSPCCNSRNAPAVIDALRKELGARGLLDEVQVTVTGSLGLCERGPNWVVYPEGSWYSGINVADVAEIVSEHFVNGRPVERLVNRDVGAVKSEIAENRNRMLASLRAKDAAGMLPDEFMDAVRGYQVSRILLTAIDLDVFTAVEKAGGLATFETLANTLVTDARSTEVLLNALVALSVLAKQSGKFANTLLSRRYLCENGRDDARDALKHNLSLWSTWSTLTDRVRTGQTAAYHEMASRDDDWTVPFIAAMHKNAAMRAPIVVRAVDATHVTKLLDIGGGSGAYSIAFAQANAHLRAEIFDLATVTPIAERHVAKVDLSGRVTARVGDLRRDPFGSGFDLALLSAICHMLGPDENQDLLRRVFAALVPGGRIAIQDHIMNDDGTTPRAGALFAVNMLVGTCNGGTFTESEYEAWLSAAGFRDIKCVTLPGPNDLVIAAKP
jgi:(2Fe-2S) ferredoxin/SAM-dependent methyltransferase